MVKILFLLYIFLKNLQKNVVSIEWLPTGWGGLYKKAFSVKQLWIENRFWLVEMVG